MSIYDYEIKKADGSNIPMSDYRGKVLLIVNTATRCGFTKQYNGLQDLYARYQEQGFEILDFPSNQFGEQAPESDEEIHQFCTLNFGIKFKQLAKIEVNGENESPLYHFLKNEKSGLLGSHIKWNFTKFLVDRQGNVTARYAPQNEPIKMEQDIQNLLRQR